MIMFAVRLNPSVNMLTGLQFTDPALGELRTPTADDSRWMPSWSA